VSMNRPVQVALVFNQCINSTYLRTLDRNSTFSDASSLVPRTFQGAVGTVGVTPGRRDRTGLEDVVLCRAITWKAASLFDERLARHAVPLPDSHILYIATTLVDGRNERGL